ncbi:MAG: DciA family protein [Halorhodospira sp.]
MSADPKPFRPAQPPRREGKLHRLAPRLAQRPGPLHAVIDHARTLKRLQRRIQRLLPEELHSQWQLARFDEQEMVVIAQSCAWATRLRYLGRALQDAAKQVTGTHPQRVTVRIAPTAEPRRRLQGPGALSERAEASLRSAAAASDDPQLRAALERLAARGHGATGRERLATPQEHPPVPAKDPQGNNEDGASSY